MLTFFADDFRLKGCRLNFRFSFRIVTTTFHSVLICTRGYDVMLKCFLFRLNFVEIFLLIFSLLAVSLNSVGLFA